MIARRWPVMRAHSTRASSARGVVYPQLDGLRAVAAGAVFLTHLTWFSGFTSLNPLGPLTARMNIGVALFFLLSAFLLYRPWAVARLAGGTSPVLRRYAVRRFARIFPAYWAALLILAVVLPRWSEGGVGPDWWVYFGLLQVYSEEWILGGVGLGVAWSLCTELAFYVALPLLAVGAARALGGRDRRTQVRWELCALAVSAVAAYALRSLGHSVGWSQVFDNTLIGKWPWFAAGMALAVISAAWSTPGAERVPRLVRSARDQPWAWWAAAAGVLLVSAYGGLLPRDVFTMTDGQLQFELVAFTLFGLLLMAPVVFGDLAARLSPSALLATRPMMWLGTISYGIFLWHIPAIGWVLEQLGGDVPLIVIGALSLTITLLAASASWYLLERPIMRLTTRGPRRRPDRDLAPGTPALEPGP